MSGNTRLLYRSFCVLSPRFRWATLAALAGGVASSFLELFGLAILVPTVTLIVGGSVPAWVDFVPILGGLSKAGSQSILLTSLVVVFLLKNVIAWLVMVGTAGYVTSSAAYLREKVFLARVRDTYERFLSGNHAERIKSVENSVTVMTHLIAPTTSLIIDVLLLGGAAGLLVTINPLGATLAIIVAGILVWVSIRLSTTPLERWGEQRRLADQDVFETMTETFTAYKELMLNDARDFFVMRHRRSLSIMQSRVFRFTVLTSSNRFLLEILGLLAIVIFVLVGNASGATAAESASGIVLMGGAMIRVLPAVNRFISSLQQIRYGLTTVQLVISEVESAAKPHSRTSYISNSVTLQFQELVGTKMTYTFPGAKSAVISNLDIRLTRGDRLAITGPSGIGKSTLVEVLLGLRELQVGNLTVNGMPISAQLAGFWSVVGYVPQHVTLVNGPVWSNVALGLAYSEVDHERVREVLRLVEIPEELVLELRGIGDRGMSVSGGQRQRIGLARALYRRPQLLVLDEATSNVDSDAKLRILNAIDQLESSATVIHVTHDSQVAARCLSRINLAEAARAN